MCVMHVCIILDVCIYIYINLYCTICDVCSAALDCVIFSRLPLSSHNFTLCIHTCIYLYIYIHVSYLYVKKYVIYYIG